VDWFREDGEERAKRFHYLASFLEQCLSMMKDPVKGQIHLEIEL